MKRTTKAVAAKSVKKTRKVVAPRKPTAKEILAMRRAKNAARVRAFVEKHPLYYTPEAIAARRRNRHTSKRSMLRKILFPWL